MRISNEAVQSLVAKREFKVLKVLREGATLPEPPVGNEPIETLLDDPTKVFEHRLEQEPNMDKEHKQELKIAFAQLLDLYETEGTNA